MTARVDVLDHGYVSLVESWGSDERIIEAARMSTQKGFDGWGPRCRAGCSLAGEILKTELVGQSCPACGRLGGIVEAGDEKLLAYLWKNNHATPFEMAGAIFEVQAPIFVFREWHRHRTQSFNEMSARYSPLPDVNYVPSIGRLMANATGSNRQANRIAGSEELNESTAGFSQVDIEQCYEMAEGRYQTMLKRGVPKELARLVLPVGRYSRMRASANLRNWLAFLTLRDHSAAQWEIRQFARAVCDLLTPLFPRTLALFQEGRAG